MHNPFTERAGEAEAELELISRSLQGDRIALEALILRHQSWIYNIAIRMVYDRYAAEDITQEVLIKLITKLGSFDPAKGAFRTWLYRIVVNHIINARTSRNETMMENALRGEQFEDVVARLPARRATGGHDAEPYRDEIKMACVQCTLFGLNRRERMIFILGAIFDVTDGIGSEICAVSKANYRKILSRTRTRLFHFFRDRCGLVNEANPCRCGDRLAAMVHCGMIDTRDLLVHRDSHGRIRDIVSGAMRRIEESYPEFVSLFRGQPFLKSPDMVRWLRELFDREGMRELFQNDEK